MKSLFVGLCILVLLTFTQNVFDIPEQPHAEAQQVAQNEVKQVEVVKDKVVEEKPPTEPINVPKPETVKPKPTPVGSCQAEIAKYNWVQSTALAVAQAESHMRVDVVNDNPATGDYSVGCFQVNIYGANAKNRPSEAELKNPQVNVEFAYKLYKSNGSSFIGQWGVCRSVVRCY